VEATAASALHVGEKPREIDEVCWLRSIGVAGRKSVATYLFIGNGRTYLA
jgi:hypothetical protein